MKFFNLIPLRAADKTTFQVTEVTEESAAVRREGVKAAINGILARVADTWRDELVRIKETDDPAVFVDRLAASFVKALQRNEAYLTPWIIDRAYDYMIRPVLTDLDRTIEAELWPELKRPWDSLKALPVNEYVKAVFPDLKSYYDFSLDPELVFRESLRILSFPLTQQEVKILSKDPDALAEIASLPKGVQNNPDYIDNEPLWKKAEAVTAAEYGRPINYAIVMGLYKKWGGTTGGAEKNPSKTERRGRPSKNEPKWASLAVVKSWLKYAKDHNIAPKTYEPGGFYTEYVRVKGQRTKLPPELRKKRNDFIKLMRSRWEGKGSPLHDDDNTPNRMAVALIMWGYDPGLRSRPK